MTPEEEIKAKVDEWQADTLAKAKAAIWDLEARIKAHKLVELELRAILAQRQEAAEDKKRAAEDQAIWRAHIEAANAFNLRLTEAMERLTSVFERMLS